ncbi:MAG: PspA/IM30 family protein [Candidatus Obscuribacter sp.]|jgi:phage shock protein A|nr:PspA/IM30 family protein [Candidatus Obscuribacter sp.]MBP6593349.1 PspA/IM30 family protein [Candidatus Obscuribacter sp.]MBP7577609.1 PspA/IM30 family protein [Candidatus Obscuribacter sp.]
MFDRLMNIIKSMFNSGVSKLETAEVLAEQAESDLSKSVKQVQDALTASITNEKMLEAQLKKTSEEKAQWEKRAALAVGQNNDEVAKQCLQKKVELAKQEAALTSQIEEQKKQTGQLKTHFAKLDQEYKDFRLKKQSMAARSKSSDAMAKANDLIAGTGPSSMEKWEEKIRSKEIRNEAMQEMRGISAGMEEIKELDKAAHLDDELAMLKAQISAKAITSSADGNQPKLIVQRDDDAVDAELVDDNVPMLLENKDDKK